MYLAKELTQKSLPEIGELFGGRDHTTVLHAVRKMAASASNDRTEPAAARAGANPQGLTVGIVWQLHLSKKGTSCRLATPVPPFSGSPLARPAELRLLLIRIKDKRLT
jgi:hypothetical protein